MNKNKNSDTIEFICICVVVVAFVFFAYMSDSNRMSYYDKKAYTEYLEVCREQNVVPQPPILFKDLKQ